MVNRKCSQLQQLSPEYGVISELTEALAHTCCAAQVLLQQVREDLQHHLVWKLLLQILFCWSCWENKHHINDN